MKLVQPFILRCSNFIHSLKSTNRIDSSEDQKFLSCILIVERLQIMLRTVNYCDVMRLSKRQRRQNAWKRIRIIYRKSSEISKHRMCDAATQFQWVIDANQFTLYCHFLHTLFVLLSSLSFIRFSLFCSRSFCLSLSLVLTSYQLVFGWMQSQHWHVRAIFFFGPSHVAVNSACSLSLCAH